MNLIQLKYVVETARLGSMSRAARGLFVAQPNLSRAIKELEGEIGITIFIRSTNGISITSEGEEFIRYARDIVEKAESVENYYKVRQPITRRFSVCVPRSGYISDAFVRFSVKLDGEGYDLSYKETDTFDTLREVISGAYDIGIIRYDSKYDRYFSTMLDEKRLDRTPISSFRYRVAASRGSRLAGLDRVRHSDLEGLYEIAHRNAFFSEFPLSIVQEKDTHRDTENRIYVFDRSSQFELLSGNPKTYMWVSPMPDSVIEMYNLVLKDCPDSDSEYYDVMIKRKDYTPSSLDRMFLSCLR